MGNRRKITDAFIISSHIFSMLIRMKIVLIEANLFNTNNSNKSFNLLTIYDTREHGKSAQFCLS